MVRSLQHAQLAVAQKPAHGDLQKAARGHVIAIEDRDEGRTKASESGIDITGLGVQVIVARHVADAGFFSEVPELFAATVVEDVDVELADGPVDIHRGKGGVFDDVERLVVGGDEEVDDRPLRGIVGQRHRDAAQRPEGLKVAEEEDGAGVSFGGQQKTDEEGVETVPVGAGFDEKTGSGEESPESVAEGGEDRDQQQREGDEIRAGAAVEPDGEQNREQPQNNLLRPGKFEHAGETENKDAASENDKAKTFENDTVTRFELSP